MDLESVRNALVNLVMELRREYLASPGCSVLRHWDQIQERLRAAARVSAGPEDLVTRLRSGLSLPAPSSRFSRSFRQLVEIVGPGKRERSALLAMIDREHSYILALARAEAERRRADRDEVDAAEAAVLDEILPIPEGAL